MVLTNKSPSQNKIQTNDDNSEMTIIGWVLSTNVDVLSGDTNNHDESVKFISLFTGLSKRMNKIEDEVSHAGGTYPF